MATTQDDVRVEGAGRTDAGAHARGQVVAFNTSSPLPPDVLERAINFHLPLDVSVVDLREMSTAFHPRFDALTRVYRYLIWNRPVRSPFWEGRAMHVRPRLDEESMQEAASFLLGSHDLSSFVPTAETGSCVRDVHRIEVKRRENSIAIEIEATGFMKQMVRAIVGTLVVVGRGGMTVQQFQQVLLAKQREAAADTAPACGLYLLDVKYAPSHCASKPQSTYAGGADWLELEIT